MQIKLKGGKELHATLSKFEKKLQDKILRRALRRGANVARDRARALAPKESGKLAKSIKTDTKVSYGRPTARVRLKGKHAYLGLWMEYGVADHVIQSKDGPVLTFGDVTVRAVDHPGLAPRPFMRPAFDTTTHEIINEVGRSIAEYVQFGELQAPLLEVDEDDD